jgi:hypothetical protein
MSYNRFRFLTRFFFTTSHLSVLLSIRWRCEQMAKLYNLLTILQVVLEALAHIRV